ncbi:hypothetical protein [Sphingomonas sp. Leaf10]|uniref:hypothetical protein n=1 Tax=Sphingomonas sp. Leaf10 TaxID=1735676 RepID=UPI0012E26FD2|nr:hypothetical protein [Sphingomonas sp. Leaf10]
MNSTKPTTDIDADSPILTRAIVREGQQMAARWATYQLPAITPLASFADYADASAKRRAIALERTDIEKELNKAVTSIAVGMAGRQDDETERQARAILEGRPHEAFEGFEELNSQVARLRQKLKGYAQALRRQDEVVADIKSERSIDAAAAMEAAHRDAVRSIAAAIGLLREAFDREEACRTLVTQAGYDDRLPNFAGGRLIRGNEMVADIERRATEYGK